MIKRYTMGRVTLAKTDNSSLQGAGIVECDHGEFYRCADIDPLLESIGAGGVSGRIISKTLDEHRAEFEAHWHSIQSHGLDNGWLGVAWAAWKVARGITE
ncbi:hypothetical protein ACBP93_08355 [Paenalcaligenes hominis]|uniref:hypothetical protein n=1 Tax=Paenalcaligenes hominis TaxID=643674 RepID=UPI00352444FC